MPDATPRLALPCLQAGQAQKEIVHNEALALLDALVVGAVEGVGANTPPATPTAGQAWILGTAPTGAWSGRAQQVAVATAGGWRFAGPRAGFALWSIADGCVAQFAGAGWELGVVRATALRVAGDQVVGARAPAIAAPSGGATVDTQARATLATLLATLRAHGLIAT